MTDKTPLDHLADAVRCTNRAVVSVDIAKRKRLLQRSNLHLLLMECQLAGLMAECDQAESDLSKLENKDQSAG